jgi:hypothetical protein
MARSRRPDGTRTLTSTRTIDLLLLLFSPPKPSVIFEVYQPRVRALIKLSAIICFARITNSENLREIVAEHAQTAVGFVKVGNAETAFSGVLKALFILPVFFVPTFPSSQIYNIKQLNYK